VIIPFSAKPHSDVESETRDAARQEKRKKKRKKKTRRRDRDRERERGRDALVQRINDLRGEARRGGAGEEAGGKTRGKGTEDRDVGFAREMPREFTARLAYCARLVF